MPPDIEISQFHLVGNPEKIFSIERYCIFSTMSFAIATAVELSEWTGVGGCARPSSLRLRPKMAPSLVEWERAMTYWSAILV